MYMYIYIYLCIYVGVYIYVYMYVYMYVCKYVSVRTYIYIYMYICTYLNTICVHINEYLYTPCVKLCTPMLCEAVYADVPQSKEWILEWSSSEVHSEQMWQNLYLPDPDVRVVFWASGYSLQCIQPTLYCLEEYFN